MSLQLKFKTVQGKQFELGFDEDTKVRRLLFRPETGTAAAAACCAQVFCAVYGHRAGSALQRTSCWLPGVLSSCCRSLPLSSGPQVADVKAKIQETQGDDFPAGSLNIIYQGKVRWRLWRTIQG